MALLTSLHVGITAAALKDWAARAGVSDLLDLPITVVPDPATRSWADYWGHGWDVRKLLLAKPTRYEYAWSGEPKRAMIEAAVNWVQAAARTVATHYSPPPKPVANPRLVAVGERIDAEIARQSRTVGAPFATPEFDVRVLEPDPRLHLTARTPPACRGGTTFMVELEAPSDSPLVRCACPNAPKACRARLHLLRWVRARMGEAEWQPAAALAEALETPPWLRTIRLLDKAQQEEPKGELGWAVDFRRGVEIKPLLCKRNKSGGYKTVYLDKEELPTMATREDLLAADRLLLQMAPQLSGSAMNVPLLYVALQSLVGYPRLYDAETRIPISVHAATLSTHLRHTDTGVEVAFKLGPVGYTASELIRYIDEAHSRRILRVEGDRLYMAEVSPAMEELAKVLHHRGARFGKEAVPELLRSLAGNRVAMALDPELEVLRRKGDVRPLVRLEAGTSPLLRVQLRSRPHPSVGVARPGEGAAGAVGREGADYLMVDRDLPAELAAAQALVNRLGLEPNPDWMWSVDDPELAFRMVGELKDAPDAVVEWGGRRPDLRDAGGQNVKVQLGKGTDWFGVGGALEIGGAKLSLEAVLEAMRSGRSWVRADGEVWVRVEERLRERLRALADATDNQGRIARVHAGAVQGLEDEGVQVEAPPIWAQGMDRMRAAATLAPKVPATLKGDLRPYQAEGFAWMTRLLHWAGGAVLADDMGLGKTIQALAVLLDRAERGPQLVVAPMSVGFNWVREAERFAPDLRVHLHHGADRPDDLAHLEPGDLVVTTWDILVRDDALRALTWATVVFDEAQAMKNADTQRAKSAQALQAEGRLALTGTPIENRLSELWSLFSVVVPGLLGNATAFRGRFATPIERDGDEERKRSLARMVRPFLLRRMKEEVARDLPPRTEVRVDVELGAEERRRYNELRLATLQALTEDSGPKEQVRFRVLAALTRLRQIACAARLVDDAAPPRSAKIDRLIELLTELRAEGRKVLVFSQFAELIRHVRPMVEAEGFTVCHLDGSTPAPQRRAEVDRFQAGGADLFLISLKAGGTGLNLTAASEVVLLDPWWNPAVEDQAADRTHRIGQTQAVTIYRLVARQTVEDGILQMHEHKRNLAGAVLDGTGDAGAMSVEELMALIAGEGEASQPAAVQRATARPRAPALTVVEGGASEPVAAERKPALTIVAEAGRPSDAEVAEILMFEMDLFERYGRGEISRSTVSNSINPLRRLLDWAGTLNGVEARLPEWKKAVLDIPSSDRATIGGALRRFREWQSDV